MGKETREEIPGERETEEGEGGGEEAGHGTR